jgi:hypothetical protein
MKPVEIVLRRGWGKRESNGRVNLRYIVNTYVSITLCNYYNANK